MEKSIARGADLASAGLPARVTGAKENQAVRGWLSAGKFARGAVEDANPPHCLVSGLSERHKTGHQRKR